MTVTSIIIPTYNGLSRLRVCVDSIRRYTPERTEIIIVDNSSRDATADYCLQEGLTLVSLPVNAGFPAACNRGMALASGDELLLMNNDIVVSAGWLANLRAALYSAPDVGMVGPVTNYASGIQQVETAYDGLDGFHAAAASANRPDPSKWLETRRLVGLCLLFRRQLMERVGLLDERFSPGHYEDDDYCMRARLSGYRLLVCGDCLVHHEGSASFKEVYPGGWDALIRRNRERFIEKWQVDPLLFI